MGNSPSNRKISVVNDEVAGVIKISDSVVKRLKGEIEREKEQERKFTNQSMPLVKGDGSCSSNYISHQADELLSGKEQSNEVNTCGSFMGDSHLTSSKDQSDKEVEIQRIIEYWQKKLLSLTDHYSKLAEHTEAEYLAAVKDVERNFSKKSFENVCIQQKDCVLECYKEHKEKPLYCANEVKDFAHCVNKFRFENIGNSAR